MAGTRNQPYYHLEYAAQVADDAVKNGPQPTALIAMANRE